MHDQPKCSAKANAFSLRFDPGGPIKKILRATNSYRYFRDRKIASHFARLTLRLLQVINQEVKGMSWLADYELLHEPFEEVEDLLVLEVLLDVLLVFKFLDLVHFYNY